MMLGENLSWSFLRLKGLNRVNSSAVWCLTLSATQLFLVLSRNTPPLWREALSCNTPPLWREALSRNTPPLWREALSLS